MDKTGWLTFIASLPVDNAAARMRVLRTLETLGCAVLREGVYLLPDSTANRQGLQRLAEYVAQADGSAHVLAAVSLDAAQTNQLQSLFDRGAKYRELIKTVEGLKAGFGVSDPTAIRRVLGKQRRELENIKSLDFFPSPLLQTAERAIDDIEAQLRAMMTGSPDTDAAVSAAHSGRSYFRRAWATRTPLFTDRLACAWLIRRFIDPEASLVWLDKGQPCPVTAVGFAFEGAPFRNSNKRVTYEEMLASFKLDRNPALAKIGTLVHSLEAGDSQIAEAAGVDTLLQGARRRATSSDELLAESEKTFDLLYEAYFELPAKD